MITFFRKIRQNLLSEGKTRPNGTSGRAGKPASNAGRYLKYAIGEIMLIMIGILLALQVSNWNEHRKEKKVEIKLLKEIQNDLEETLSEIVPERRSHIKFQNSGTIFQNFLLESEIFNDTILPHYDNLIRDRQTYPKTSGYELLHSKGMDIVSKDSLRKKITDLYQLSFSRLVEFGQSNEKYSIRELFAPFDRKHFKITNIPARKNKREGLIDSITYYRNKLVSYEELRNDLDFLQVLQSSFRLRERKISLHERAIEDSQEVLTMIGKELKRLE